MPEDKDEEIFEIVDDHNSVLGRRHRGQCHSEGLKHRAVYCLVFDTEGQLLLQQRADKKKIGPGQWDLSLAEHLQPGETYEEAVVRGLEEELGIKATEAEIQGPLAPCHLRELVIPGLVHDAEFVQTHRLDGWRGSLDIDFDEVKATRWMALEEVYQEVCRHPESFTSWLRAELGSLKAQLLQDNNCASF